MELQPHEWANLITRNADSDVRTAQSIIDRLENIHAVGEHFRLVAVMQGEQSRATDDVVTAMEVTSRTLDAIRFALDGHYEKLRAALIM